jgi:hypothetical protein
VFIYQSDWCVVEEIGRWSCNTDCQSCNKNDMVTIEIAACDHRCDFDTRSENRKDESPLTEY